LRAGLIDAAVFAADEIGRKISAAQGGRIRSTDYETIKRALNEYLDNRDRHVWWSFP
jgi:hypothetical protein